MGNLSLLFKFSWYYFREEDIPYTKNKQAKLLLTFIGTKEGDKGEGEALKSYGRSKSERFWILNLSLEISELFNPSP